MVASQRYEGLIWTHNDSGGEAEVVGVYLDGRPAARIQVRGARARDWEDLALGPCAEAGSCLYIGDIGDGGGNRPDIAIYRIPEPDPVTASPVAAEALPLRYPDGARDAEALFVLPGGEIYLVSKGRLGGIDLFRYPMPLRAGETVTLEHVRTLSADRVPLEEQVTGAAASPSGEWVAIRRYKRLEIWRPAELLGAGAPSLSVDLTPLGEVQGEAVALLDNGAVILTSEGGFPGAAGTVAVLSCALE